MPILIIIVSQIILKVNTQFLLQNFSVLLHFVTLKKDAHIYSFLTDIPLFFSILYFYAMIKKRKKK